MKEILQSSTWWPYMGIGNQIFIWSQYFHLKLYGILGVKVKMQTSFFQRSNSDSDSYNKVVGTVSKLNKSWKVFMKNNQKKWSRRWHMTQTIKLEEKG